MPRGRISRSWSEFVASLLRDLEPVGYFAEHADADDGLWSIRTSMPDDPAQRGRFWERAHHRRHLSLLTKCEDTIHAFEAEHADVFVRMELFEPSAVRPVLEIVDFSSAHHCQIIDYLALYQSVTSRMRVGRQMGLLVWDEGQASHRPLIGAAVLASPRYSQRLRDRHLGWPPHYPRTSVHFDERARTVREAGLARMMQLSIACALPPYNLLSGAWLLAVTPFTALGQKAFAQACKDESNPDLAAVVTTTGKGISGAPFRGHRVGQLSNHRIDAAAGAHGDVYTRARPGDGDPPLLASFESLVSPQTADMACALLKTERPQRFADAKDAERVAMAFALRRIGCSRRIFDGNEIGVHIAMLGCDTAKYLTSGKPRPKPQRPRLDFDEVVGVWRHRFLPSDDSSPETATPETLRVHTVARRRRILAAQSYPEERIRLSHLLEHDVGRLSVRDFVAPNDVT
jgi:hypothetical protein